MPGAIGTTYFEYLTPEGAKQGSTFGNRLRGCGPIKTFRGDDKVPSTGFKCGPQKNGETTLLFNLGSLYLV